MPSWDGPDDSGGLLLNRPLTNKGAFDLARHVSFCAGLIGFAAVAATGPDTAAGKTGVGGLARRLLTFGDVSARTDTVPATRLVCLPRPPKKGPSISALMTS